MKKPQQSSGGRFSGRLLPPERERPGLCRVTRGRSPAALEPLAQLTSLSQDLQVPSCLKFHSSITTLLEMGHSVGFPVSGREETHLREWNRPPDGDASTPRRVSLVHGPSDPRGAPGRLPALPPDGAVVLPLGGDAGRTPVKRDCSLGGAFPFLIFWSFKTKQTKPKNDPRTAPPPPNRS